MPAWFKATVGDFITKPPADVVGALSRELIRSFSGDHAKQRASWFEQVTLLQESLDALTGDRPQAINWGILFEYPLLRLQRRLDIVVLAGQRVAVVEFKVGADSYQRADVLQVEDYALDLRDFHEASRDLTIVPILCATDAPDHENSFEFASGVAPTWLCSAASGLIPTFGTLGFVRR